MIRVWSTQKRQAFDQDAAGLEIDRLAGHVAAARTLIEQDGASGRRLDFLTQEFMREANTLCSKSAAAALTAHYAERHGKDLALT